jgi:hypothetical protein
MKLIKGAALFCFCVTTVSCDAMDENTTVAVGAVVSGSCRWTQVTSPNIGMSDNSLSSVSGGLSSDVWAVGSVVPDSNPDITTTLINHFDGRRWSAVASPNVGHQANSLNSVTTQSGKAWAVGFYINASFTTQSLIEAWNGSTWNVVAHPQPGSSDMLSAVSSASAADVWAVGYQTESRCRRQPTIRRHRAGRG